MKEVAQKELRAMRRTGFLVYRVLLKQLRAENKKVLWRPRPLDQLRLGILQVWATRHKVPLTYVVRTLLQYWRGRVRRPGKKTPLLGVTIAALTAKRSEPILQNTIERDYPGQENISQWQTTQRLRLLGLDEVRGHVKSLIDERFPDETCNTYQKRIEQRSRKLNKASAAQWRRRRRWRGNPWL